MSTEVSTERMQPHSYSYDSFQLVGPVRHGGMATVRQACLKETGAICALKFPKREGFEGIASLSLTRELKALSDLEHNNIVRLFGLGTDGAERFLVFEWLQETLEERIRSLGPSDWRDYYEQVGRPLLEALRYAHARGRVHRDLKPSNVMFSDQMVPKITDFGIARDLTEVHIGRTFAAVGSHPWTPAEQDDGMQSERRDLYSWAAICVASLTGRLDYRSSAELRSAAEKLQSVAPSHLLTRCLSDTPEERPVSATALLWDLDDYHRLRLDAANVERLIGVEVSMGAHQKLATLIPNETITSKRVSTLFGRL